jgi:hypothetical protein
MAQFESFKSLLLEDVARRVAIVSYEQIGAILSQHGEHALAAHVSDRLNEAAAVASG